MKNRVFVFFVMLIMLSCKEEKVEFVQSKVKPSTFLLKNLPRDDKSIKEEIKSFLSKNLPNEDSLIKNKKEFIIAENFYQKQIFFIDILGIQVILLKIKKIQIVVFQTILYLIIQKIK